MSWKQNEQEMGRAISEIGQKSAELGMSKKWNEPKIE